MSVYLSPVGSATQFFTDGGLPLNGGQLATYAAGSTTPVATYTTAAGTIANANPIILDTNGRPPQEIWLTSGQAYKFVLSDSLGNLIKTFDNISGINDVQLAFTQTEWLAGPTPTFISTTQITCPGNQTATLQVGRRVQITQTSGIVYGTIVASVYGSLTTVTIILDGGASIDSGISVLNYAFLNATNPSVPMKSGIVHMWPSNTIPSWALLCDGSSYNIAEYPGIYAVIGTSFGASGGAGTFDLPDFRGRSPIGVGSAGLGNTYTLAQKYGEELHQLSVGELAAHNHPASSSVSDPGHFHTVTTSTSSTSGSAPGENYKADASQDTSTSTTGITVSTSTSDTGSNTGHNTVHPVLGVNYIITI